MKTSRTTTLGGSGNPAFGERIATQYLNPADVPDGATMSVGGVAAKTVVDLVVLVAAGAWGWASATTPVAGDLASGYANTTVTLPGGFWLASFAALFVAILVAVEPRRAPLLGIVYAGLQGYLLGAISAAFNAQTNGIVGAALLGTVSVFAASLALFATGVVKPTSRLAFGVSAAIGGLCLLYFVVAVVSAFDWGWLYSDDLRVIGIVVSTIAIALAALTLTLDFASIDAGVRAGAPAWMGWYSASGLTVALIWLYVEILRLLALLTRER